MKYKRILVSELKSGDIIKNFGMVLTTEPQGPLVQVVTDQRAFLAWYGWSHIDIEANPDYSKDGDA